MEALTDKTVTKLVFPSSCAKFAVDNKYMRKRR